MTRSRIRSYGPMLVLAGALFGCNSSSGKLLIDAGCGPAGCGALSDVAPATSADTAAAASPDGGRVEVTAPKDAALDHLDTPVAADAPNASDAGTAKDAARTDAAMDFRRPDTGDAFDERLPRIVSFTASPAWVAPGGSTLLMANFVNATTATVDHGIAGITNGAQVSTGPLAGTTTFTLTISNAEGNVTASTTVSVVEVTATSAMSVGRRFPTASLLPSGKVLVVGGSGQNDQALASAELYDPATRAFTATGPMAAARTHHQALSLANGKVLVVGGLSSNGSDGASLATAEVYDPTTGSFSPVGPMTTARSFPTLSALPDGKVLVVGGYGTAQLASAEIFDPTTASFVKTGSMSQVRAGHSATLTLAGTVLVAGGYDGKAYNATAEIFNPLSGTFSEVMPLTRGARTGHAAALLPDGSILLAAGYNGVYLSSFELWKPATGLFEAAGDLAQARSAHAWTSLADGRVLLSGGYGPNSAALSSVEIFDPAMGRVSASAPMLSVRADHTATLLADGRVLLCAGQAGSDGLATSAEVHTFY